MHDKPSSGRGRPRKDAAAARPSTRQRLVDAARQLFYSHGYHATGLSQVLEKAGVNSGSLYYSFRSKEQLLLAVLDDYKRLLWPAVIQPAFDQASDPIDRVLGVLASYRTLLESSRFTRGCPIGNLSLEVGEELPAARLKIVENFEGWRLAIRGCLEQARDRLSDDVDLDRLSSFILTAMEGGVMQARAYRSLRPFDDAVEVVRDYIRRLIRTSAPDATNDDVRVVDKGSGDESGTQASG